MNIEDHGRALRAARIACGERRGRALTLMEAAKLIAVEAQRRGIAGNARHVPRSHASLTRWELGNVRPSLEGLEIIAAVYEMEGGERATRDHVTESVLLQGIVRDGAGLCWARHQLGWSHLKMAKALRMHGPDEKLKSRLHEMEIGNRHISGAMSVAIEALVAGFRPSGFEA